MPLNKSFLDPIQKSKTKKKELPTCFTNRLNELNTVKHLPQYIPNTRTPALRPIPQINPRYMARLNDTQDFKKEIQESEINKEVEKELDQERHLLRLKFDPEVVNERSSIPFGITPRSKLLTPVMKKNDSGILSSFLSENSLCKNGNLNIVEKTINFGITPDIFEYLRQHSKSVSKNEYYHYLSEPPSLGSLRNNYENYQIQSPLITSLTTHNLPDIYSNSNRPVLQPIKSISSVKTPVTPIEIENNNTADDNIQNNEIIDIKSTINNNNDNRSKEDKENIKIDNNKNQSNDDNKINENNDDNSKVNNVNDTEMTENLDEIDENLNNTLENKKIVESYYEYIHNTSKELTDMHRLTHFPGINSSDAYKKTENVISNSTFKYICNVVQNRNEDNNINNKGNILKHKKKGPPKSLINSENNSAIIDNNYWINSIMNGFKDEQLVQDLTHTERIDSKTPIYRQSYPANIQQMHIDIRKKSNEEKRRKYEKLMKDINQGNSATKSNPNLNYDFGIMASNNIPNNNDVNNPAPKENISRRKLFRIKHPYLTISLIHFSSLLKSDPSRQITTYNFEKNDFIKEEDIIPLNLFLKSPLSNYQGPIPKPNTQMFYHMYSIFIQGLKSQDKEVRFESMNGIAKLDCIEMIPQSEKIWFNSLLNQVITEGTNDDKWNICTMLCRHGIQTVPVINYLKSVLGDTDTGKRNYVIYLLSRISEKNINCLVKNIIFDKLKDANWRVRLDCIKILRRLLKRMLKYIPENELYIDIDKDAIKNDYNNTEANNNEDDINKILNNEKLDYLKKSKSKNGSEMLVKEKDSQIVNQALQIVMNIMWFDWKLDVRNAASRLLMKIGKGKPIYSWIIQMISSDNPMKKINGLKCIGYLNVMTTDAIEPFLKCFDDVFSTVRIAACKVAYILELNYPPLIQKLANCFDDNSWEVRAYAVKAMSRTKCQSNLINDTVLWNLVHETNHRVLYETIKAVRKLNLINESSKIKEALLLLSEDKNENIAGLARRILIDNGILFEKNNDIDFTSPEDIVKEKPQKEINILYNTRPPFNFACDGLDMIKHEVNLLTMKDYITSEIMEQEKQYKNYSRNEESIKYSYDDFIRRPSADLALANIRCHSPTRSNNNSNNNKNNHYKLRIIDDMTFNYIEHD